MCSEPSQAENSTANISHPRPANQHQPTSAMGEKKGHYLYWGVTARMPFDAKLIFGRDFVQECFVELICSCRVFS